VERGLNDWPLEKSLLGEICIMTSEDRSTCEDRVFLELKCNSFMTDSVDVKEYSVDCFKPFVKPDGDGKGLIRKRYRGATCDLPCPANFLFPEEEWDKLMGVMYCVFPSFFILSFLLASWMLVPKRHKMVLLRRFIQVSWCQSLLLVLGFLAIPSHAPKYDLRFLQCKDNVEANGMGLNFCTVGVGGCVGV